MKIEFIYTFDCIEQQIAQYSVNSSIFLNKMEFISFACANLTMEEKGRLIKISCCVTEHSNSQKMFEKSIAKWYSDAKGKIWLDDLDAWRTINEVPTLIDEAVRREWYLVNDIKFVPDQIKPTLPVESSQQQAENLLNEFGSLFKRIRDFIEFDNNEEGKTLLESEIKLLADIVVDNRITVEVFEALKRKQKRNPSYPSYELRKMQMN